MEVFADRHEWLSTDPESGFVKFLVVQRRDADGVDVLKGCTVRRLGDGAFDTTITTEAELREVLTDRFRLDLSDVDPDAMAACGSACGGPTRSGKPPAAPDQRSRAGLGRHRARNRPRTSCGEAADLLDPLSTHGLHLSGHLGRAAEMGDRVAKDQVAAANEEVLTLEVGVQCLAAKHAHRGRPPRRWSSPRGSGSPAGSDDLR